MSIIAKIGKAGIRLRQSLSLYREVQDLKVLQGKTLIRLLEGKSIENIREAEFRVFSQFGDDGIIQYLIGKLNVPESLQTFVEFGVEDYSESNTRFLLVNNNWRGLVMDGNPDHMETVRNSGYFWRHDLQAVAAFIDRDNINKLLTDGGMTGEIGLLSVDIDGNDYWVWDNLSVAKPWIVVSEYNSVFGKDHAITVPYDPMFYRAKAHYSNLFWGCSLKGLTVLANRKGYALVGGNSAGNNVYFVRRDKLGSLREVSVETAFVSSRFRESRDASGNLTFLTGEDRIRVIGNMKVHNIETRSEIAIKDLMSR
jgi:hypothetical protein